MDRCRCLPPPWRGMPGTPLVVGVYIPHVMGVSHDLFTNFQQGQIQDFHGGGGGVKDYVRSPLRPGSKALGFSKWDLKKYDRSREKKLRVCLLCRPLDPALFQAFVGFVCFCCRLDIKSHISIHSFSWLLDAWQVFVHCNTPYCIALLKSDVSGIKLKIIMTWTFPPGGGALTFGKGRGVRPQNLKPYP